jgi:hypothetical protein
MQARGRRRRRRTEGGEALLLGCLFPCPVLMHKRRQKKTRRHRGLGQDDWGCLVSLLCVSVPDCTLPRVSRGPSVQCSLEWYWWIRLDELAAVVLQFRIIYGDPWKSSFYLSPLSSSHTTISRFVRVIILLHLCFVDAVDVVTVWSSDFAQNLSQSCRGICVN